MTGGQRGAWSLVGEMYSDTQDACSEVDGTDTNLLATVERTLRLEGNVVAASRHNNKGEQYE